MDWLKSLMVVFLLVLFDFIKENEVDGIITWTQEMKLPVR